MRAKSRRREYAWDIFLLSIPLSTPFDWPIITSSRHQLTSSFLARRMLFGIRRPQFVARIIDESPPATSPGNVTNYSLLSPEDFAMSDAVIYRVFKLPASLLTSMREKRDQVETTNVRFLADAIDSHLPNLVKELQRLGFGLHGGDQQVTRLPFSDESATLSLLRDAAEVVGLPTTKLLELCLVAALHPHTRPKRRRRRRPKSDEAARTNSKRPRRQRKKNTSGNE